MKSQMTMGKKPALFFLSNLPILLVLALFFLFILVPAISGQPIDADEPIPEEEVAEEGEVIALAKRPNIVVFISDDQHWADMTERVMPQTYQRVFQEGITFTNAYVTTPWCCPSRSSIFTGRYASRHGVLANSFALTIPTVADALHDAGYYTGIIGKYLNSSDGTPRKEYDYWRVFPFGNTRYTQPLFNEDGKWVEHRRHIAPVMNDYVQDFLQKAKDLGDPFLLYVTPNIPHRPAIPEKEYRDLFKDDPIYTPKNNSCRFRRGKPRWVRKAPCLSQGRKKFRQRVNRSRADELFAIRQKQTLRSLDDIVGATLNRLEELGELDNTAIFFISDNGLLRGSFKLTGKPFPYEDAIYVPFAFRYPRVTTPGMRSDALVANIDIAPTIYRLSRTPLPEGLDGSSLLPLIRGEVSSLREDLLIEGYFTGKPDRLNRVSFAGLKSGKYTLIVNKKERPELYDMEADPYQTRNIALSERRVTQSLYTRLVELRPEITGFDWVTPRYRSLLVE